jgi:hypothetical protein
MRDRKRWIAASSAALVAVVTVAAVRWNPQPPCAVADAWVAAHQATLPRSLSEFSKFDLLYRRRMYQHLPLETRRALWREHLATFTAPGTSLSPSQVTFVRDFIAQIDQLIDTTASSRARLTALQPQVLAAFGGKIKAIPVFGVLGPMPVGGKNWPVSVSRASIGMGIEQIFWVVRASMKRGDSARRSQAGSCGCSGASDFCLTFCATGGACVPTPSGCGLAWQFPCDGNCTG